MREWMPLKITEYSICVFVYCLLQLLWKLHASEYGNNIAFDLRHDGWLFLVNDQ